MQVVLLTTDLMLLSTTSGIAERRGMTVTGATNGQQVIEFAGSPLLRLIAIDLRQPGLDIHSLVGEVRRLGPNLKVVAFGPHVHEQALNAAAAAGCDEVFTRGQFERRMDALLAEIKAQATAE
jgi:CheY-like chemotaxis protein